jgi:hypothetical protein
MLYNPPIGWTDPNAPYIQGDAALGVQGSKPPAIGFEGAQREIVNAISASGQTPSNGDMTQLAKAISGAGIHYGVGAGTANSLTATVTPAITALTDGMVFVIKPAAANTLSSVVFNPSGLGGHSVYRADGSALLPGDIPIGSAPYKAIMIYDQASNTMLLQNPAGLLSPQSAVVQGSLSLSSAQNLTNGVDTQLSLTGPLPFATVSGGTITFTKSGIYSFSGTLKTTTTVTAAASSLSAIHFLYNGSINSYGDVSVYFAGAASNSQIGVSTSWSGYISAGDTFAVNAQIGSAGNGNITLTQATTCGLSITKVL